MKASFSLNARWGAPMGATLLCVGAVNAIIFGFRFPGAAGGTRLVDPPGWFVGAVWTVLFALFGLAYWKLPKEPRALRWSLAAFMLFCLAYPFYTSGLSNLAIGFIGNVISLIFAIVLVVGFWKPARLSALLVSPAMAWLTFATWAVYEQLR